MKNKKEVILTGLFVAIISVMSFVPYTGFLNFGVISITTLHIPLIIGSIALGIKGGLILGTTFGVLSFLKMLLMGTNPIEVAIFTNPMVAIVPRAITGLIIALMFKFIYKVSGKLLVSATITAVFGTITHTILVITAMNVFEGANIISAYGGLIPVLGVLVGINGLLETGLAFLVVPPIVIALSKAGYLTKKTK